MASAKVIAGKYTSNGRVLTNKLVHFDNDMILSTLSISSRGFALCFPNGLILTERVFFY